MAPRTRGSGVIAALLALPVPAWADSGGRIEASGFLGVEDFSDKSGLGGSPAPEQRPQTAPTLGGRLTFIFLRFGGHIHLDTGFEIEGAFTPAWTGYGFDNPPRPSYFAPVVGYRGNLIIRIGGGFFQPFFTIGGGGESVFSDSPFMAKETDPIFQYGVGAAFAVGHRWSLRLDARQGMMESIDGGTTFTYHGTMSVAAILGGHDKPRPRVEAPPPPPPPVVVYNPPDPNKDSDGDGVPDRLDACPQQPETVNGVEDQDGCPERDSDGDGLVDQADKCPDRAEDKDGFQDEDGCADDDNDRDGIPDLRDRCPLEPENLNGLDDLDGCPDQVPAEITAAFANTAKVTFEKDRARLSKSAKAALDKALAVAISNPKLKITLTLHPEGADAGAATLAQKRLDVVKFYLTEQGVAMGNLTPKVGAPIADPKAPLVEMTVTQ